jgi:hypothetical protein
VPGTAFKLIHNPYIHLITSIAIISVRPTS